jgi:hypothetical protein
MAQAAPDGRGKEGGENGPKGEGYAITELK